MFGHNIENNEGRGILIYIHKSLTAVNITINFNFKECALINLTLEERENLLLACVYRSPSSTCENNGQLLDVLRYISKQKQGIKIVYGDFNFPNIEW